MSSRGTCWYLRRWRYRGIDGEVVTAIRTLAGRGVGKKAIARELGVSINTVRRYVRQPTEAGHQVRPAALRLTDTWRDLRPGAL